MTQIKYGTKEFQEAMNVFESMMESNAGVYVASLERASKEDMKEFAQSGQLVAYNNGETNKLFKLFLSGINFGIRVSAE